MQASLLLSPHIDTYFIVIHHILAMFNQFLTSSKSQICHRSAAQVLNMPRRWEGTLTCQGPNSKTQLDQAFNVWVFGSLWFIPHHTSPTYTAIIAKTAHAFRSNQFPWEEISPGENGEILQKISSRSMAKLQKLRHKHGEDIQGPCGRRKGHHHMWSSILGYMQILQTVILKAISL